MLQWIISSTISLASGSHLSETFSVLFIFLFFWFLLYRKFFLKISLLSLLTQISHRSLYVGCDVRSELFNSQSMLRFVCIWLDSKLKIVCPNLMNIRWLWSGIRPPPIPQFWVTLDLYTTDFPYIYLNDLFIAF